MPHLHNPKRRNIKIGFSIFTTFFFNLNILVLTPNPLHIMPLHWRSLLKRTSLLVDNVCLFFPPFSVSSERISFPGALTAGYGSACNRSQGNHFGESPSATRHQQDGHSSAQKTEKTAQPMIPAPGRVARRWMHMDRASLHPHTHRMLPLKDPVLFFGALMDPFGLMDLFEAARLQDTRKH